MDCLQDVKSDSMLRNFIDNIITLALEGNHLCRLIAKHGGVRSLLTICVNPRRRNVRVNAFRALGTVCCVLEGIMELEDAGGIEILSDTLKDDNATEEEKSEAAGLLAQVTSPWIENNNTIEGLSRHLNDLVQSLTSKLQFISYKILYLEITVLDPFMPIAHITKANRHVNRTSALKTRIFGQKVPISSVPRPQNISY